MANQVNTLNGAVRRLEEAERECARLRAELAAARDELAVERSYRAAWLAFCPDGYVWTDPAGVIREANRAAGTLLGLPPGDLVGQPLAAALVAPALTGELARLVRGEIAELRLKRVPVRGEGGGRVSLRAAAVPTPDGRLEGVWWLIHDANEMEQMLAQSLRDREAAEALAALLEQERELLATIMTHTEAQLAFLDPHFRFVRVNAAYERGSGYARQELIGRGHFDLFPDAENQATFERVRDSGQAASVRARPFVFPDHPELGTTYWDWTLTPISGGNGSVQGLVLSLVDVTARVRHEQESAAYLARLEALLSLSQEMLAETTAAGVMQRVAGAARDWTGARLKGGDSTRGVLIVSDKAEGELGAEDEVLLAQLAALATLALRQIEAREEAERQAAESRAQRVLLEQLMAAAPVAIAVVDAADYRYRYANPAYERISGGPVVGHTVDEVFDVKSDLALLEPCCHGEIVRLREYRVPSRAESAVTYWNVDAVPLRGPGGEVEQLLLLGAEVSDQVAARHEIEALAARDEAILGSMTEGVVFLDLQGQITYMSPTAMALYGVEDLSAAQRLWQDGETLLEFLDLEGRPVPAEDRPIARLLRGERFANRDLEVRRRDVEHTCFASYSGTLVYGLDGEPMMGLQTVRDISERMAAQRILEAERALMAAIVAHAPAGIVVADARGRIILANPTAEQLYQRPVPYGQPFEIHAGLQILHADGRPCDPRDLPLTRAALDGEATGETEMAIVWPTGERRDLLGRAAPIDGPDGLRMGGVVLFQDVTERKRTAERAQRYAERLRILHETDQAIRAAPAAEEMAEAVIDQVRRLAAVQHVTVTLFDLAAGEMRLLAAHAGNGQGVTAGWRGPIDLVDETLGSLSVGEVFLVPDVQGLPPGLLANELCAQGVRACLMAPLLVGGELIGSLNVGLPDPAPVPEEQIEIIRELANGLAIGIHQARLYAEVQRYARDLERLVQRRTVSLAASEARFRAIFEEAALGIALLDREGRITASNPALRAMLDRGGNELADRRLADFAAEDAGHDAAFQALIDGQQRFYQTEQRYLRSDGRVLDANVTVSLLSTTKGRARAALAMVEDVTARKQALAAMVHSERLALAGQLATSLAHEINNPLQSVVGCLGLAIEVIEGGEDAGEFLQVAMDELLRASRVVHRLRELGRPVDDRRKQVDLNELLQRVVLLTTKRCQEQHVTVDWTPKQGLPLLSLAADRIQQVFLNIVINAIEAMPQGGRLAIDVSRTDASTGVMVRFADTGPGIAPQVLPTLFEPFYSTKPDGTGLGLYVSQQMMREHGGRIEAQNGPERGAVFTVWLPEE